MKIQLVRILTYFAIFLAQFIGTNSYADGSKDLYPVGALGARAFLVSASNTTTAGWPFMQVATHYAYAETGEIVAAASSAQGMNEGIIKLTAPDGAVYLSTKGTITAGYIANRTQELAGPNIGSVTTGYVPFTQLVSSTQEGLWKVEIFASRTVNASFAFGGVGGAAAADWTGQNTNSHGIRAWDVSVIHKDGQRLIPGRVYTTLTNMYISGVYHGKLYVLTDDGYTYKVNNNGNNGLGFAFFVNNKGLTIGTADDAPASYKSLNQVADIPTKDPRESDGVFSITQKMFYTMPNADLPEMAKLPDGSQTWLRKPKIVPKVSDISIVGVEGIPNKVSSKGANINFYSSRNGISKIVVTGPAPFVPREISSGAIEGNNRIFWDGKDGNGNIYPGAMSLTVAVRLQGAEVHFPFIDMERNAGGIIIEQINDDGSVVSDKVYWDDTDIKPIVGVASNPIYNGNDGLGISSNINGHKWNNSFGDVKTMDTWTYILGDNVDHTTLIDIQVADLEVVSVAPVNVTTPICVDGTVTYDAVVFNNGPSDVTGATFQFVVPAGLEIGSLADVSYVTTCGSVRSGALDAGGNYTALLDMPNGCEITFTITGTVGAALAGQTIHVEANIMRPNDVTDPDATNPDPSLIPTDPHLECLNGTATENCNNIKYDANVAVSAIVLPPTSGGDQVVCADDPLQTLTATATVPLGLSILWYDAEVGGNLVPSPTWNTVGTVTYYAEASNGVCESPNRTAVTLTINETPNLVITNPFPVCLPGTVDLTAAGITAGSTPGLTLSYFSDAAGTLVLANPDAVSTSGTYYIKGVNSLTECFIMKPVEVILVEAPEVIIGQPFCLNGKGSIAVVSPLGTDFEYSLDGATYQSDPIFGTVDPGSYQVTARHKVTGCVSLATAATINAAPVAPVPQVTQPDCFTATGTIFIPKYTGATYSINGGISFVPQNRFENLAPGTYTVYIKDEFDCVSDEAVVVIDNAPLVPTAPLSGGDQTVCADYPVQKLTATASVGADETLVWYDAPTGGNVVADPMLNTIGTITYYAEAISSICISASRTEVVLTINAAPHLDPISNQVACVEFILPAITGVNLSGNEAYYTQANGMGTKYAAGDILTTIGTTTFYVYDEISGCFDEKVFTITIDEQPIADAGADQTIYNNGDFTLDATTSAVGTGKWSIVSGIPSVPLSNLTDPNAIVSLAPNTEVVLRWTVTNGECVSFDDVLLSYTSQSDLVTVKATSDVGQIEFVPGESVEYVIRVTNNGPSDATNVTIQDTAPVGTSISTWTAQVISGVVTLPSGSGTGDLNETILTLPNGAEVTYTVTVQTPADFASELVNAVEVDSDIEDPNPSCPECSTPPLVPTPLADIVTVKVVSDSKKTQFIPGESVDYSITVTNNGPSDASDVNVVDTAPLGTVIKAWTADVISGDLTLPTVSGTGNLNESIVTMPSGAVVKYIITVETPPGFMDELVNTVQVTSSTDDPDPSCTTCTTTPLLRRDFTTAKSVTDANGDGKAQAGEELTYTISITNTGDVDLQDMTISDAIPTNTIYVAGSADQGGTLTLGQLDWTVDIPVGTTQSVSFKVEVTNNLTGVSAIANTAAVTDPNDPNGPTPPQTPSSPPVPTDVVHSYASVKSVTDANGDGKAQAGEELTYTITIQNTGDVDLLGMTITDAIPANTTYIVGTADNGGTLTAGNLNWTIDVPFDTSKTVSFTVEVTDNLSGVASIANTATVTDPNDPNGPTPPQTPSSPPVPTDVVRSYTSVKSVTDANSDGKAQAGEELTYTITIQNTGDVDLLGVTIQDAIPTNTSYVSGSADNGGTLTVGSLNWTIDVPFSTSKTVSFRVKIGDNLTGVASIANTATVTDPNDPNGPTPPQTPSSPPVPTDAIRSYTSVKSVTDANGDGKAQAGEELTYTITIQNTGDVDLLGMTITDAIPANTTYVVGSADNGGTLTVGSLNWTIDVPFSTSKTVSFRVKIGNNLSGVASIANTARVTDPNDPNGPTPPQTPSSPPIPTDVVRSYTSVKSVTDANSDGKAQAGEELTYTITIQNTGDVDLLGMNIHDAIPENTTYVVGSVDRNGTLTNGSLTWTIDVPLATTQSVSFKVEVTDKLTGVASIANTATVNDSNDPNGPTPPQTPSSPLVPTDAIRSYTSMKSVADANGDGKAQVNEELTYTITVQNTGKVDLLGMTIRDAIPANTSYVAGSADNGGVLMGSVLNWTLDVPLGASQAVSFKVKVADKLIGVASIANTATVNDPNGPTPPQTPSSPPVPTDEIRSYMSVKSVSDANGDGKAQAGEELTYTILLTNTGDVNLQGMAISDAIPANTAYVVGSADQGGSLMGSVLNWKVDVPVGASRSVSFKVKVTDNLTGVSAISNTATVNDPNHPNGSVPPQTPSSPPVPTEPLMPEVSDDRSVVKSGDKITIPILENDTPGDTPFDLSTFEIVEQPLHGTLTMGVDGTVVYTPYAGFTGDDVFTYRVKDSHGNWSNVATVAIAVEASDLFIPNVFTPNGDGKNDKFAIVGLEGYASAELAIFNRWGNEVYRSNDYKNSWDGSNLNEGTYYYMIILKKDGKESAHKGWVLLKR